MQASLIAFERHGFSVTTTPEAVRVAIPGREPRVRHRRGRKKAERAITFTEQKLIDRGMG